MGKFANKPNGRPSKRTTLKVRYKVQRKVKQHNKRMRREAKKFGSKQLRPKSKTHQNFLPNMFPFKQQLLDEHRKTLPQTQEIELNILDQTDYGLINIENKCAYLPRPKDNLIKKYITNLDHTLQNVSVVLEMLDAKRPQDCIDKQFRQQCQKNKVVVISVLTKVDTVSRSHLANSLKFAKENCESVVCFSIEHKKKEQSTSELMTALKETKGGNILVVGKALTGKHSLITTMAKAAKCYNDSPCELQVFKLDDTLRLINSPYKIEDNTGNAMFMMPNPVLEDGLQAQEEKVIRKLFLGEGRELALFDRDQVLEFYEIQDYVSVTDFVTKVGRSGKYFGKGGSIDLSRVRTKVITDWFNGKLNYMLV